MRFKSYVPGSSGLRSPMQLGVVGLFYVYLVVVLMRIGLLVDSLFSSVGTARVDGWVVLTGLLVFYVAGVAPGLLRDRRSGREITAAMRRFRVNRLAVVALLCFLVFLAAALLAPLISPHDPVAQDDPSEQRYQAPSRSHPMGTDKFGRDIFSRVLYGSRVSLGIAVFAVALAAVIGLIFGAFSGYVGGWFDDVVMRIVDGLLAFPRLLLVLTLLAFFANSFWLVVLLLAVTGWMGVARLVRAEVLSLKEQEFVYAAVAAGVSRSRIVWRHLVPNTLGPVLVAATLRIGAIILLESYLSFLGLGVQPPTPSWGSMVFAGRDVLISAWWVSAFPGLAIVSAVVSCNLLGDGLRDAMDVKAT